MKKFLRKFMKCQKKNWSTIVTNFFTFSIICFISVNSFSIQSHAEENIDYMIKPVFEDVGVFCEGLAPVKFNEKWGYIDKTGKLVISLFYDEAKNFTEGLAAVKIGDKWGYIDTLGKVVIPFEYDMVSDFKNGTALVTYGGISDNPSLAGAPKNVKYIDKNGKAASNQDVQKDLNGYQDEKTGKWGYKDKNGKVVIEAKYKDISSFSEGLAKVQENGNFYYIDSKGNIVFETEILFYRNVGGRFNIDKEFHDGFAVIGDENIYTFIDKKGKKVTEQRFIDVRNAGEGIAAVKEDGKYNKGRWGFVYLDKEMPRNNSEAYKWYELEKKDLERYIVKPKYDEVKYYYNGVAEVMIGGKCGLVDINGNEILSPEYKYIYAFPFNVIEAEVANTDEIKYFDKSGNRLNITSEEVTNMKNACGRTEEIKEESDNWNPYADDNKLWGFEDKKGKILIKPQFILADNFKGGYAAVVTKKWNDYGSYFSNSTNRTFAIINTQGKIVVPPQKFQHLYLNSNNGMISVNRFNKVGFVSVKELTPDGWALNEVLEASNLEIVPDYLKIRYNNGIKREEFCDLIVDLIEQKLKKPISQIVMEKSNLSRTEKFKDTDEDNIMAAYKLGIVNGVGNGYFAPNGTITRQEAAVMIANTAKILGESITSGSSASFLDSDLIADWAKLQVNYVNSKGIMKGTESKFNPKEEYTRQQAILTALRLYKIVE